MSIVVGALLVIGLALAMTPGVSARPAPACAQAVTASCPGAYCVDQNLDGKFGYGECTIIYCLHGCCDRCPPPNWD